MSDLDPYMGPWTDDTAAHLWRRAGFGARPSEIAAWGAASTMDAAVDFLVDYSPVDAALEALIDTFPSDALDNFGRIKIAKDAGWSDAYIQGWWLFRMVHCNQPLQEQFTLFLHDHMVSEWSKVGTGVTNRLNDGNDGSDPLNQQCTTGTLPPDTQGKSKKIAQLLQAQNFLLRETGHGNFRDLMINITRDPAMLIYLDNRLNISGKAQENYAREMMELFSMGVGNYTEDDVREIARALTGETLDTSCPLDYPYVYTHNNGWHDKGSKTVFGQAVAYDSLAPLGAETLEIIDLILDRISGKTNISPAHAVYPAAALHMSWKFINWFVNESIPIDHPAVAELGDFFYSNITPNGYNYDVRETLRKLLKSELFYDAAYRYNMYKRPADFISMALRMLDLDELNYTGSGINSGRGALALMGMQLFSPPNVAGWNHGQAWINSGNMVNRMNYGNRLSGTGMMTDAYVDSLGLADNASILEYFRARLLQQALDAGETEAFNAFYDDIDNNTTGDATTKFRRKVRGTVHLMVSMPLYQLK